MKHTINIISDDLRSRALLLIAEIPLEPQHVVIIRPSKITREVAQNSTYWLMMTHLEKHSETGYTKDEFHEMYKEKHLLRIYIKSPDDHPILVSNIEEITKVMELGMRDIAKKLWENLLKSLSTTDASVHEFWEYLQCIEAEMRELNCVLPVKDDIYKRAMGIKV